MMRFSALNKQASSNNTKSRSSLIEKSSQPTKEVQESAVLQLYHEALKQQQSEHYDEAKSLYSDILHSQIMTNDESGSLQQVKFVIYKNLANIAKERGDLSTAVSAYIEASKLDGSDVMLWYQLGVVSGSLGDLLIMRKSLEECLRCNKSYWPAISLYFSVLLALQDYYACLQAVSYALHINPHYKIGLSLLHHLISINPEYLYTSPDLRVHLDTSTKDISQIDKVLFEATELERKHRLLQSVSFLPDSILPNTKLKSCINITALGQFLIAVYKECIQRSQKTSQPSLTISVSLYSVMSEICGADESKTDITLFSQHTTTSKEVTTSIPERRKRSHGGDLDFSLAPKRRSNRVRAKERETQDYFMLVKNYIPPKLKITDLPELGEVTPLVKKLDKKENDISDSKKVTAKDGERLQSLSDVLSVKEFIHSHLTNNGIIHLINDLLSTLSTHYDAQWSKTLPDIYINCYELIYLHLNFPTPLCDFSVFEQQYGTNLFQISLCYLELKVDWFSNNSKSLPSSSLSPPFQQSLQYIQQYYNYITCTTSNNSRDRWALIRIEWLRGKWFLLQKQKAIAMEIYIRIQCLLAEDVTMTTDTATCFMLPNCLHDSVVSKDVIDKKIDSLQQLLSLEQVQVSYSNNDYNSVIDILLTVICQESYKEFFLSHLSTVQKTTKNHHGVYFLLESLYKLERFSECILYSTHFLMELLLHYQEEGHTDEWCKTLNYIYTTIDRCFVMTGLLNRADFKVVQILMMCIIKTLYVIHDISDSIHQLSLILPWKILHVIISFDDWSSDSPVEPIVIEDSPFLVEEEEDEDIEDTPLLASVKDMTPPIEDTTALQTTSHPSPSSTIPTVSSTVPTVSSTVPTTASTVPTVSSTVPTVSSTVPTTAPTVSYAHAGSVLLSNSIELSLSITATSPNLVTTGTAIDCHPSQQDTLPLPVTQSTVPLITAVSSSSLSSLPSSSLLSLPPSSLPPSSLPSCNTITTFTGTCSLSAPPTLINTAPSINFTNMSRRDIGLCFLKLVHSQLGSYSWCCHDNGSFLLYIVSMLRQELKGLTNLTPNLRELLLLELEQCYYCLYGYPYKKAKQRGLMEHGSEQVKITWSGALDLIEYFHPYYNLPSIDDQKSPQVTPELITLYKKIIEVVPSEGQVVSMKELQDYIEETINVLPTSVLPTEHSSIISEIYYLLADDSLKALDNVKAIKYYQLTLNYCTDRFDAWAGLALAKSRKITEKIDNRDVTSTVEKTVSSSVRGIIRCFREALKLKASHCYIVEKFGLFCYTIQSFASQIIKLSRVNKSNKGTIYWSEKMINDNLELSQEQFKHALTLEGTSHAEPWIYHFVLGKISWKLRKPLEVTLHHLIKSAEILCNEGAAYPPIVEVSSKGHAIEALEVHYQFMSISLKALLSNNNKEHTSTVKEGLTAMNGLPLCQLHFNDVWKWAEEIIKKYNETSLDDLTTSDAVHSQCMSTSITNKPSVTSAHNTGTTSIMEPSLMSVDVESNIMESNIMESNIMESNIMESNESVNIIPLDITMDSTDSLQPLNELILPTIPPLEEDVYSNRWSSTDPLTETLYGVAVCAVKFPAYFKPLYRLANTLYDMNLPEEAKKFLLGPLPECFISSQEKLQPIFALKTNIFQNMWQITAEEINRPGNFSSHAHSCLQLLLKVLEHLNDFNSLLFIAQQLKSKPDTSKQFMRESERSIVYIQTLHICVKTLQSFMSSALKTFVDCHKTLLNANSLKNMLTRAEGRKDESVKTVEKCMLNLFGKLWSDMQVRALFLRDGFPLPHEPTIELCNKYCSTCKDKDLHFLL